MSTDEEYLDNLLKAFEEEEKIREKENPVVPEVEAIQEPEMQDEDEPEILDESYLESVFAENMVMDAALLESALAGTASLEDALFESPVAVSTESDISVAEETLEEVASEETFEETMSSVESLLENALLENDSDESSLSESIFSEATYPENISSNDADASDTEASNSDANDAFLENFFAESAALNEEEQGGLDDDLSAFFAESVEETNEEQVTAGVDDFAEIEKLLQMAESNASSEGGEGQDAAIQELVEEPKEKKKKKKRGLPWKKKAKEEEAAEAEEIDGSESADIVLEDAVSENKEQEDAPIDEFAFAAGLFDSASDDFTVADAEAEQKGRKKAKKEKKKKEKAQKEGGGFFGKLLEALSEEDEEEGSVTPEGEALEEDEILKQLEAEEKAKKGKKPKKEKKKKNKKKDNEGENPDDLDFDAEGDEEGGKGKKKKKRKEKKVKEKPEGGEIVKEKGKKVLSRKSFLSLIAFCASLIAAIVCLSAFLPDYVEKKQAREAFYAGDYEEAYVLLYGKNLNAGDELIFGRVSLVLQLERKTESYYFHQEEGKQAEALNSLFEGVRMYQEMVQGDVFGAEEELQSSYKKILDILNQQYAIDEAYALEIISYNDLRYSEKVYAIVDGTDGAEEEAPAGPEDILPEEEAIIQTQSGNEGA